MQRWLPFTASAGALVLASYVWGVAGMDNPELLWGGVDDTLRQATFFFMAGAVAGFFVMAWGLHRADLARLAWPWALDDGMGERRLLLAMGLFLFASAVWLPVTRWHIEAPQAWKPALVVAILAVVAAGNILLLLLGWAAWRRGRGAAILAGASLLAIQTVINDLVIWSLRFPW